MLCAQVLLQAVHAAPRCASRACKSRAARMASAELALAGLLLLLATRATIAVLYCGSTFFPHFTRVKNDDGPLSEARATEPDGL